MQSIISRKRSRTVSSENEPQVKIAKIHSSLPARMIDNAENDVSPQEYVMQIVNSQGMEVEIHNSLSLEGFFSGYSEEDVAGYDADVLNAIRNQDITKLREFHESGRSLHCSNNFGESLLHLACRRNFVDVVKFLVHEANVSVRIRDDYGRTILHDAAWTCEPNFELVTLILSECPDLLYMSDRRGHTPTQYARRSHWGVWNQFFMENKTIVLPTLSLKALQ